MKLNHISSVKSRRARTLPIALAAGFGLIAAGALPLAAEETDHDSGFMRKVEKWQDKMSDAFHDTWQSLRGEKDEATVSAASVDLREQQKSYTIRLSLPGRDLEKVNVSLDGDTLHIIAPAEGKLSRYEQSIALADLAADAKPSVDRRSKDDMVVIGVPKRTEDTRSATAEEPLPSLTDWDRRFLGRMEKMRREMDRIFNDSFDEFRLMPEHKSYFDEFNFGSSVDLKDEGDHYLVTAYLPARDMDKVSATVDGLTLRIEAKAESSNEPSGDKENATVTRKAEYVQIITLPGPVDADHTKIERKDGVLTVTLPKS